MIREDELIKTLLTIIKAHTDVVIGKSLKLRKNSAVTESKKSEIKAELSKLRLDIDKNRRMFKSLYENHVSGLITSDEYRDLRENYETKMNDNLTRITELENRLKEFDKQIAEYIELSELMKKAGNKGITAELIDRLVEKIRFYSDKSIEVDFKFVSEFDLLSEVPGNE
jgi:DNA repair exonuclease SbcCD ATPase subunit